MELRNIINEVYPTQSYQEPHKIVHELNNQGCRCNLCQKIVVNENKIIHRWSFTDQQSENTKGNKQNFLVPFLMDYFSLDKLSRKIKFMVPQICIFEKGAPSTLITKKRENGPMKIVRNKQKLNAFEIQNFFTDGYLSHNQVKSEKQGKFKNTSREQYYNYRQVLKNECIVLAKFNNNSCQMLNMIELTNLFKSKQRHLRNDLVALYTLVNAKNHNQIRVPLELNPRIHNSMLERAKTQVKIINEDIKTKDFMFVTQKEQQIYQQQLKQKDVKKYLEYLSMKLILLYSMKTDVFIESSLFKYIKGEDGGFFLTDIQVYTKTRANLVWGQLRNSQNQNKQSPSPDKKRKRPTSSPQRLQGAFLSKADENKEQKSITFKIMKQNQRIKTMMNGRTKASSVFKLEPIINSRLSKRK